MQHMQHPSSSSFMLQWKMILDILKGAIVLVPFSVDTTCIVHLIQKSVVFSSSESHYSWGWQAEHREMQLKEAMGCLMIAGHKFDEEASHWRWVFFTLNIYMLKAEISAFLGSYMLLLKVFVVPRQERTTCRVFDRHHIHHIHNNFLDA